VVLLPPLPCESRSGPARPRGRGEGVTAARRYQDVTAPISTGGGTRRVQLVREGGGGGEPAAQRL